MSKSNYLFKVGDIVIPKDGGNYQGEIILIDHDIDTVKQKCLSSGKCYENSILGMTIRYKLHPNNKRLRKLRMFR